MAFVQINSSQTDAKSPIDEDLMDTGLRLNLDDHEARIGALEGGGIEIQDFTEIGDIGDSAQQMAGHIFDLDEPAIAESDVIAMYLFKSGANFLKDESSNNYDLINPNDVISANGIFGADGDKNGAEFGGYTDSDYLYNETLLDVVPDNIVIDGWVKFGDGVDGVQSQDIFYKLNSAGNGILLKNAYISSGIFKFNFATATGGGAAKNLYSTIRIPDGETGWFYFCCAWDTTYGKRMWIYYNGAFDYVRDYTATTLMLDGTTEDFIIGANEDGTGDYLGGSASTGTICILRIYDKLITNDYPIVAASTRYGIDSDISIDTFKIYPFLQNDGDTDFLNSFSWDTIESTRSIDLGYFYRKPFVFNSTDKLKILMGF